MKLLYIRIENFGKLQNFEYRFGNSLHVLHQPNGWGKSTLAVFIKAMLYGLPASTKRMLDENERKKYAPWQGGAYGGSLEFEADGRRLRVERFFGEKESADTFDLYDLDTNLPSDAYSERLGEELFGIDADGFERTVYLSQRDIKGGRNNSTVSAKLGNLLDDVDDVADFDCAMEALDKRRKFYVMTGGRGAIADMEQEILDKTAELERCRRIEEAMCAQEAELSENAAALDACKKAEAEVRTRLERAALAREQRALIEQKERMLTELAALSDSKKQILQSFSGNPPTDAELRDAQALYEEIKRTKMRLDTIPPASPDADELADLSNRFSAGLPDGTFLAELAAKNDELRRIDAEINHLKKEKALDPALDRFASGVPSKAQIDRAFEALRQAEAPAPAPKSAKGKKRSPALLPLGILGLLAGLALVVTALLPSLSLPMLPLLIVGSVLGFSGIVLLILSVHRSTRNGSENEAVSEWQARRREHLDAVKALLDSYRMPTEDPVRSLSELSILARRHAETLQQRESAERELNALLSDRRERAAHLIARLSVFLEIDSGDSDFGTDIHRLQGMVERYRQLYTAEGKRASDRKNAQQVLLDLKKRLLLFLRHHDPDGKLSAGQCLVRIAENLTELRRLEREIERRTGELRSFIAEKHLGETVEPTESVDLDRLSADAEELQTKTEALNRRHATLKSSIERLSLDADRIPDLEEQIAQVKERLAEAKANAETIKNTAKFLEEAKTALSTRYLGGMQDSLSRHLQALTEASPDAVMDASFSVQLRAGGKTRVMESFSQGWRDMVDFCARLALVEALYQEGEKPFLLLDDPFTNLDDDRMDAAKQLLARLADDYQVLYLVCHETRSV